MIETKSLEGLSSCRDGGKHSLFASTPKASISGGMAPPQTSSNKAYHHQVATTQSRKHGVTPDYQPGVKKTQASKKIKLSTVIGASSGTGSKVQKAAVTTKKLKRCPVSSMHKITSSYHPSSILLASKRLRSPQPHEKTAQHQYQPQRNNYMSEGFAGASTTKARDSSSVRKIKIDLGMLCSES